ncbi:hypothetical protein PS862_00829 [Pseudomonas fluorescens]|uniref:Uncharacterized protein n=1 Tax=Pseudomonas fluorescens TaxID=294 RepID=A0A5E7HLG3_PSEFL|nr:hypothetical protein [Pseudomonas fluorescens]VVO61253.1 hypothetical protein PS862_00829 [Pseudomonas fluorescens]
MTVETVGTVSSVITSTDVTFYLSIAAALISLATFIVGYSQMRIASAKIKLDLYNKRFNVYLATLAFFQSVYDKDAPSMNAKYDEFAKCCRESQFLFDEKDGVFETMRKLIKIGGDILSYDRSLSGADADATLMLNQKIDEAKVAFGKELIRLEDQLTKYISFKTIAGW